MHKESELVQGLIKNREKGIRVNQKFNIFKFFLVVPICARKAQQLFQMTKLSWIARFSGTDKIRNQILENFRNRKFQTRVTSEKLCC